MGWSFIGYLLFGTHVAAYHSSYHQTKTSSCFGVCMMAKGFGNQSNRKVSEKVAVPSPPSKVPAVGELPEDSFSQFPPLTPEQQRTLVGAKGGGGRGLPPEVRREQSCFECSILMYWYAGSISPFRCAENCRTSLLCSTPSTAGVEVRPAVKYLLTSNSQAVSLASKKERRRVDGRCAAKN